jgi:2-keto-4-pentenoate hydratase/2-oxohepta-3-ene-1,7-dioic acid hydratase in catechol pathway
MRRVRFRDSEGTIRSGELIEEANEGATRTKAGLTGHVVVPDDTFSVAEIDVLAPSEPSKIVCVGLNYADHAEEQGKELPDRPLLFLKAPNAVASHGEEVELLAGVERIDHEAELGVVMGERAKGLGAETAMDAVAGFTCVNDLSNRDDQRVEQNWVRGKAFDGAAPMGPVLATPEEVPADAAVRLRLNGETRQESTRDQFVFSVPELVEEITAYVTLEAGDVIATGTPAGVGPLHDGDRVEVEVEGVGTLSNTVSIPE